MPGRDIIVVGASAGGVDALKQLVRGLPPDLPAAVFAVLHVSPHSPSVLPRILSRAGPLPAVHAVDGEPIAPGRVYVAPPDFHLLVKPGHVVIRRGPRENGHRPAVDPLFRTAARSYGPRVIGVVLSGVLGDGTAGLLVIKAQGGIAVVQHPDDALYAGMPRSALEQVDVDHSVPVADMPALLAHLVNEPVSSPRAVDPQTEVEAKVTELDPDVLHSDTHAGTPSGFGCPECGGALWRIEDGQLVHFRCRVGHAWSAEALLAHQSDALESALWTALRALEEQAVLARQLAARAERAGHPAAAGMFLDRVQETEGHAEVIRRVLLDRRPTSSSDARK